MSSLWIGFDRVVDKVPNRRPWKADLNDRIDRSDAPGVWFSIDDDSSSSVNSTVGPPRSRCRRHMKAALKAVSFASDPAMPVKTWLSPLGATLRIPVSRISAQSWEGKLPRAGRLIRAVTISGLSAAFLRAGLLYPTGMEAIWA